MKAYTINKYSKDASLQLSELARPEVKENEVLVEIHAASVNQIDGKLKSGEFKLLLPYKFPMILGHDVAGVVTKIGSKVTKFKVDDEVYARPRDLRIGTFAEYIAIDENDVAPKPKNLTMEEAASIPLVALTAWQAFYDKAKLQKSQKVFIQAGSGGVGTIAIQLAKHIGATVATTASAANIEMVKNLGADIVIDYKKDDFETILKDYDVVLNSQDTQTLEKSLRILKPDGKLISISGPPDMAYAKENSLSWFMKMAIYFLSYKVNRLAKKLEVDYAFLFMNANGQQLADISTLIEAGKIVPVIDKVFAFEQTNDALNYVMSGRAKGKVVIKLR
jgi:NADPH:quinone reductase-like Zn-dependent oxidoreductase